MGEKSFYFSLPSRREHSRSGVGEKSRERRGELYSCRTRSRFPVLYPSISENSAIARSS